MCVVCCYQQVKAKANGVQKYSTLGRKCSLDKKPEGFLNWILDIGLFLKIKFLAKISL